MRLSVQVEGDTMRIALAGSDMAFSQKRKVWQIDITTGKSDIVEIYLNRLLVTLCVYNRCSAGM